MISIELENTFKRALTEGINLFLGSGFSLLAEDCDERPMPTGSGLASELIDEFNVPHLSKLSLAKICTILEAEKKEHLHSFFRKRFSVNKFDSRYYSLDLLNIKKIFTTNIDDLILQIYAASKLHYLNDVTLRGPSFRDREAIDFVPLHGSILNDSNYLNFGSLDIATAFRSDPDKWHFLTEGIQKSPTLFWGYSLEDSGVLEALSPQSVKSRSHKTKWITLRQNDEAAKQYFRALGFNIIISDTSELLDYIYSLNIKLAENILIPAKVPTSRLFSEESPPPIGKVPVRPLLDFYSGAAPIWFDIYSDRLHKTTHFYNIKDSINSGKDTIVIGGKSSEAVMSRHAILETLVVQCF